MHAINENRNEQQMEIKNYETDSMLEAAENITFQETALITQFFIGGRFLKKLWCCVGGRV